MVTATNIHHSLNISSTVNPQTQITSYFDGNLPEGVVRSTISNNIFFTTTRPIPTLPGSMDMSLDSLWSSPETQCVACDGSFFDRPITSQCRKKKRTHVIQLSPCRGGWSSFDCKSGNVHMGRTTGHLSASRGEWMAIVFALSHSSKDKPLLIHTDHHVYHASCLMDYIANRSRKQTSKMKHRDLIREALRLYDSRTATTQLVWVKSHMDNLPNTVADHFAKLACQLPFCPPKPSASHPGKWFLRGVPLLLPDMAPLLDITEEHHPEIPDALKSVHPATINMYLSSLPLLANPNPKLVTYMHGRVTWPLFGWWHTYKVNGHCHLCGTDSHPTDVLSSLSQCCKLRSLAETALCNGYKHLASSIQDWLNVASDTDRRDFFRNLVPRSLVDHLHKIRRTAEFTKLRKTYKFLPIMAFLRISAEDLYTPTDGTPNPSTTTTMNPPQNPRPRRTLATFFNFQQKNSIATYTTSKRPFEPPKK